MCWWLLSFCEIVCPRPLRAEATMAAVRADYDAKVAELMAELEGTRGEKEKAETDLAFLKVHMQRQLF